MKVTISNFTDMHLSLPKFDLKRIDDQNATYSKAELSLGIKGEAGIEECLDWVDTMVDMITAALPKDSQFRVKWTEYGKTIVFPIENIFGTDQQIVLSVECVPLNIVTAPHQR